MLGQMVRWGGNELWVLLVLLNTKQLGANPKQSAYIWAVVVELVVMLALGKGKFEWKIQSKVQGK